MARRLGWTDDQINNLHDFENRSDFTDSEKAALRLAERVTRDAHSIDDQFWSELRKHFDEGEVIELLAHASVQSGDLVRARDLYQKLATLEPGNPLHIQNYQQVVSQLGGTSGTKLITPEEARDARRIDGHRISAKPHTAAELLRVVEENLPRCAEA